MVTSKNILVTCTGSGPSKAVVEALQQSTKYNFNVIGIDMDRLCTGTFLCDKFIQFPSFKDQSYSEKIYKVIEENDIDFIIPTYSPELNFWAKFKPEIEAIYKKCKVVSNDTTVIEIANNKNNTIKFCKDNDITIPEVFAIDEITDSFDNFPIIIKPDEGSGAKGIYRCNSFNEYLSHTRDVDLSNYIAQKFIEGPEYTCDVVSNLHDHVICVVPKRRLKIVGGAAIQSVTENNKQVIDYVKNVSRKIKNKYTMNVQVIKDIHTGTINMVEINPRFPTSLPLTTASGVNIPEILIDNYYYDNNIDLKFKDGLVMHRYYTEYITKFSKI